MVDWLDVSSTAPRIAYTATAAQTLFTVPFIFFESADLVVYKNDVALTLAVDYTVTGAEVETGGTVTLLTGATAGDAIMIVRDVAIVQTTHIPPSGPLDIPAVNIQFSKLVAIDQQLYDRLVRSVSLQESDPTASMAVPLVAARKGKLVGFDTVTGDLVPSTSNAADVDSVVTAALSISRGLSAPQVVATIAALKAVSPFTGAVMYLEGSASINDGLADHFYWNASSVLADDGVMVIQPNAGGVGRWIRLGYQLPAQTKNQSAGAAGNATVAIPYVSKMHTFRDLVDFGVKYDWDQVAYNGTDYTTTVQNAISDVRGLLRVSGKVLVNDTLTIPGDMIVQGIGRGISGFVFKTGFTTAKNGLVVTSGGVNPYDIGRRGRGLSNFGIFAQSGTVGLVPIVIDMNDGRFVNNYTIDQIMVDALWGGQKSLQLSSSGADGFFCGIIQNCSFFSGGLDLQDAGDSIRVLYNTITGGAFHAVYYAPVSGAAQFLGMGNSCTTDGGSFTAVNATQAQWIYNQCEQVNAYVGSFGAMVTLSGSSNCDIIGNNLNARDFADCVLVTTGSAENVVDRNSMNVQTATPRYHYRSATSPGNTLGEANRYTNHNGGAALSLRSPAVSKDANSHTRGLQSGPLALTGGWSAGGDVTMSNGLFSTRYGRQVRLDGQITGGTVAAATVIAQLPSDHWPTLVRRVPVVVDNAGVWSMGVVNINTIGQVAITAAFAGNTLVHFDGTSFEL